MSHFQCPVTYFFDRHDRKYEVPPMDVSAIGRRIKLYRQAAHITQDTLAKAVGCTIQHIGAIERGVKTPRLDTFVTIANTLGVSPDLLLQDVMEMPGDEIAAEFASATAELPRELKIRILKALRSFCE